MKLQVHSGQDIKFASAVPACVQTGLSSSSWATSHPTRPASLCASATTGRSPRPCGFRLAGTSSRKSMEPAARGKTKSCQRRLSSDRGGARSRECGKRQPRGTTPSTGALGDRQGREAETAAARRRLAAKEQARRTKERHTHRSRESSLSTDRHFATGTTSSIIPPRIPTSCAERVSRAVPNLFAEAGPMSSKTRPVDESRSSQIAPYGYGGMGCS